MTSEDVETVYTAMAECIHRVGRDKSSLLLATLALDLLHRQPHAEAALDFLRRAEKLTQT